MRDRWYSACDRVMVPGDYVGTIPLTGILFVNRNEGQCTAYFCNNGIVHFKRFLKNGRKEKTQHNRSRTEFDGRTRNEINQYAGRNQSTQFSVRQPRSAGLRSPPGLRRLPRGLRRHASPCPLRRSRRTAAIPDRSPNRITDRSPNGQPLVATGDHFPSPSASKSPRLANRFSQSERRASIHCSATDSPFVSILHVRTLPTLVVCTSPLFSRTCTC